MEDKNRKVSVKNRSGAVVIINIPNRHIRVELQPGQTITSLTFADVEEFSYQPGGDTLLREYLQLAEAEIKDLSLGEPQPEYFYSEEEVKKLLNEGSIDEFLDCLDFAPTGVIDLIKKFAVSLPLTDTRKLAAIQEKTGFNAAAAIQHDKESKTEEEASNAAPKRRVTPTTTSTPKRRVIK